MAQRRSRNRRLSARRSSNVSGFLDDDTNVYDGNDPLWFNRTPIRPSTSIGVMTRNDSSILNPDSTVDVSKLSPNWHKDLPQSNSSKLMAQAVQKNISEHLNNEQNSSSRADPTTESESEHESQKRRANFRTHQAKNNKSENSNIFLKALEETAESHTRNLKNCTTAQESESEHEYEKKRTRFRTRQKISDKSEKSNIFLQALEERTDSHIRTLIAQTSKDHESESTHDESTSSRRLRPKLFQTPNSPARRLTTGQTSQIHESKSIHDESINSKRTRSKVSQTPKGKDEISQNKSNRNSLLTSINRSTNGTELAKSSINRLVNKEKSNITTVNQNEKEDSASSEVFEENRSELHDESDEENIYDGSFNKNATLESGSQKQSLKRKPTSSQSQKLSSKTGGIDNISESFQLNDESDEDSIYDGPSRKNEKSKNDSQSKSSIKKGRDHGSQAVPDSEILHKSRKKNSSNIGNYSNKNESTERTLTINEVQDLSKTLERSLHKSINESKRLTKSRQSHSQHISEANNSTTVHNSDEENSTMPRYIRRTQSRLFQKSQRVENEENSINKNNENSRIKNSKTQELSKDFEKNPPKASIASHSSPSLRQRQSKVASTPNNIETQESDEENSTIPKYIRRTKSRLFQKSQTVNFDDEPSVNRQSKNLEVEPSQTSNHMTNPSMLRDAMNRSTSLMKPRVMLTRMHNPDSSTESHKENRLENSRAKNSPGKSKRQITVVESNRTVVESNENDADSSSKSKQKKIANSQDSSAESHKENRLENSRAKNLPGKSKRQITVVESNENDADSSSKSKQQKIADSQGNVSYRENSPRNLRNQTASATENRGKKVSRAKNSPRKSRSQKVSVEEDQSNASRSKLSQNKSKQSTAIEENKEANESRGRHSLLKSKQPAANEVLDDHPEHTVSLPEEPVAQEASKEGNAGNKAATTNERSRSKSHSSVETSSDRTPVQQQEQGALSDSSALPSDELYHTPNPAQSTLKLSGKPLRRLTQFSFRGWDQESMIAPIAPQPALAAAMRTRTIAEEPAEASPQPPTEKVSRHPSETIARPEAEATSQHPASGSPRRSAEATARPSAKALSRHSAEASPRNATEASSRHSTRTSVHNAAETSTRHSERASGHNAAEASSRDSAQADSIDEDVDVEEIDDNDGSHVSDYPLLTRQLNEIPYENERTTDNEDPAPSINSKAFGFDDQMDQNVSTIEKSVWTEVKKKTDALKIMMEAQMKRERERREQEVRRQQQAAAKLKRIMAQKAAEKRKREKKPVDKAFLVNGKVYKQPKLPRPQKWATDRLYKHLWKCMEPRYGLRTRVKSEQFILKLANFAKIFERRKKYENYEAELNDLLHIMAKLNIITTRYDFYRFCWEYMPYSFRVKVRPMMMPGNVRNIPYNSELTYKPILSSNEISSSESESEANQDANQVS